MADKKVRIIIGALFVSFVYLLVNFALTAQEIKRSIHQLEGSPLSHQERHHILLIAQELDNPYWRKIEKGARDAAELYGVDLEYTGPYRNNLEDQIKLIEKSIFSKVDGIIVQGLNAAAFTPVINEAQNKGVPLITVDTDAPTSKRLSYVGTNNQEAGKLLGHKVVQMTAGRGDIGVIMGDETADNMRQRLDGFQQVVEKFDRLRIVSVLSSNISRIQAVQQTEAMLRAHPEINIMVGTSALDAVGILQAVKTLKREDILIFGFDDLDETLLSIAQGSIQATVIQKPYEMGFDSVKMMNLYLNGKAIQEIQYTPIEIIDQNNVRLE
ncbi:sugar-binding protein [Ammoniphilus sp. 3BR4]|uniref:sugar-binding protein n=1 Tax=Ammoniphilus sp. 3BR4 TaxID=3158265 RepID=UPI0034655AC9